MQEDINKTNTEDDDIQIQEQYESILKDLKVDLNNFLYPKMPPSMTLIEFEDFGIKIFEMINEEWVKRLNPKAGF